MYILIDCQDSSGGIFKAKELWQLRSHAEWHMLMQDHGWIKGFMLMDETISSPCERYELTRTDGRKYPEAVSV